MTLLQLVCRNLCGVQQPLKCQAFPVLQCRTIFIKYFKRGYHRCSVARKWTEVSKCFKLCLPQETRMSLQADVSVLIKLTVAGFSALGVKLWNHRLVVSCDADKSRVVVSANEAQYQEPKFDWKKLWELLLPHLWHLIAAVASALVVALLNIRIPQLIGNLVNVISHVTSGDTHIRYTQEIKAPALHLMYMYGAQAIFTFFYIYTLSSVGERVAAKLRQNLFASIIQQDIAFFDSHRTGELVSRLTADIQDFKSSFKLCISQGLRSLTQMAGCAISLYLISPQMTGGMLIVVPAIIITGTLIGSLLRKLSKKAQAQVAKATAVGEEALGNIRTVRAFAMEDKEINLYSVEVEKSKEMNEKLGLGIGLFQGCSNLFLNGIVVGTLYIGGYLLSIKQMTAGDLMSFLVATQTIQRSMAQMTLLFGQLVKGISSGARVFEYINMKPSIPVSGGKTIPFHSLLGDVQFENVTFAYPSRPQQNVLKNFNIHIHPGRMVALVGTSGGGKSTVASLVERFYDVKKGTIRIDGIDIKELDPSWLRGCAVGFINQEPVLFATTVMENIRYGHPEASNEEVMEAAKLANAHDFIEGFPDGYNTMVGERGVTVSGGQKQRIAIARALLKNPSVLILDEATSALDAESEKIVQEALDRVVKGRTVLIIAHRLSTIQNADIIAVLNKGIIAEMGTHETLKELGGLYWDLIRQQQKEEETDDDANQKNSDDH